MYYIEQKTMNVTPIISKAMYLLFNKLIGEHKGKTLFKNNDVVFPCVNI